MQNFDNYKITQKNFDGLSIPSQDNFINQNHNIFALINEHKKRLNEIKNTNYSSENEKYSFNDKMNITDDKDEISNNIKTAKDFLNYSKMKTSKIFSNIDNSISNTKINNSYNSNYINYDIGNDFPNINYNTKMNNNSQFNYYSNTLLNEYNNFNRKYPSSTPNGQLFMKTDSNFRLNNYNNKGNESYKEGENILINSNIKLLKHKLENKESKIKSLENNINHLNNENQNLKKYINKLESNLQTIKSSNNNINSNINTNNNINNNNINDIFSDNSQNNYNNNISSEIELKNNQMQSLINKENISTINDNFTNIEKIMNIINYFIRKMYILFNNIFEEKEKFNDLNYTQHFELQKHLIKIENIVNDFFTKNIKKDIYDFNKRNIMIVDNKNENDESISCITPIVDRVKNHKKKIKVKKYDGKSTSSKKKKINIGKSIHTQDKNIKRSLTHNKIIYPKKDSGKIKIKKKYN